MESIKRFFFDANDFYESISPLITFGFYSGVTPFRIYNKNGESYIALTRLGYIPMTSLFILYAGCYLVTKWTGETIISAVLDTKISRVGDLVQTTTGITGVSVVFVTTAIYHKKILYCLRTLAEVDRKLKGLGVRFKYQKIMAVSNIGVTLFTVFCLSYLGVCYSVLPSSHINPSIPIYFTYLLPHGTVSVFVIMLFSMGQTTFYRYLILNEVSKF